MCVQKQSGVLGIVLVALLAGCTATAGQSDLGATVEALETQVSQQEEWISYQSTQIMAQQEMIVALATRSPAGVQGGFGVPQDGPTLTPYQPVDGSVLIHGGGCCVGGNAGDTLEVDVQFNAYSLEGEVVEMRVLAGPPLGTGAELADQPWEPFRPERVFSVLVATNWTTFWVHVQYRDESGMLSPVFSDEIGVEGH